MSPKNSKLACLSLFLAVGVIVAGCAEDSGAPPVTSMGPPKAPSGLSADQQKGYDQAMKRTNALSTPSGRPGN